MQKVILFTFCLAGFVTCFGEDQASESFLQAFEEKLDATDFSLKAFVNGFNDGLEPKLGVIANQDLITCSERLSTVKDQIQALLNSANEGHFTELMVEFMQLLQDLRNAEQDCSDLERFYREMTSPIFEAFEKNPITTIMKIEQLLTNESGTNQLKNDAKDLLKSLNTKDDEKAGVDSGSILHLIVENFDEEEDFDLEFITNFI